MVTEACAQILTPIASPENTAVACRNGTDDDADGVADCGDPECSAFVFCAAPRPTAAPVRAVYSEPEVVETRSLVWLQVWGAVMWPIILGTGVGVTAAVGGDGEEIGINAIPLAGPWMCMAMCSDPEGYVTGLVVDGVLQFTSLLFIIIGSAVRVERRSRGYSLAPWLAPTPGGGGLTFSF